VLSATWFVLAGMGIVFLTLALLVLVMTLLNRWLTSEHGGRAPHRRASGATDPQPPSRA
jgi:Na+-transporting methylmalonyl-CoA/oxaloacetate decarboxylase gamma subunit